MLMYMKQQSISAAEHYRSQLDPSDYLMEFDLSSLLNRQAISGVTVSTGNNNSNFSNQSEVTQQKP
jgi:hypothetical protein